ncbi:hypothetical protein KL86DPRO_70074 [uncultured delta proteobacterium]|uniref:Methyltransferase type 11 domain-containing protein n=1 Tax=uncultured delta proteobacterium TaxID=34034 RepID=A0A212KGV3_9DELT|nr:hypothetical protein KL86DPRO_70074 [uncultured delta proteobacterium]
MSKRLLALSWCMPPMVTPRAINVSRSLAALKSFGWQAEVIAGDLPESERAQFTWGRSLAEKYKDSFAIHYAPYGMGNAPALWIDAAFLAVADRIRQTAPHVFVTFAQPFSDHIVGLKIKYSFPSLPWVAHFSDPWTDNPYESPGEREFFLECQVAEKADALVFTTARTQDLVMKKYPSSWLKKCIVVPHGFEGPILMAPSRREGPLHLVHAGGIYGKRVPYALLDSLATVDASGKVCLLSFVGPVDAAFMQRAAIVKDAVEFIPPTTPEVAERIAQEADVLLVCDAPAQESVFLPSKLIDYLPLGIPILALTPANGSSADLLSEVGGICVDPLDVTAQVEVLRYLAARKTEGTLSSLVPDPDVAQKYSIKQTTRTLATMLERMASDVLIPDHPKTCLVGEYVCPRHGVALMADERGGWLLCGRNCTFPVQDGVPRFVPEGPHASPSENLWTTLRKTQLDSWSGTTVSRDRLTRILGSLDQLHGKKVLEAGCGIGRFSEVMLQAGASLYSFDLSSAVVAARENCIFFPDHHVCQASILAMPFKSGSFDVVVCIGVVQQTPNPEETIAALAVMVKPGGRLFIGHYAPDYPMFFTRRVFRCFLMCMPLTFRLPVCSKLRKWLWPLHVKLYALRRKRFWSRIYRWLCVASPLVDYQEAYPQLSSEALREWAFLDMYDYLTDMYKHLRTTSDIRKTLEGLGFVVERCEYAGNGVEASARRPQVGETA